MNLHYSDESSVEVVTLCFFSVEDIHGMSATGNGEDGLKRTEVCGYDNHREGVSACVCVYVCVCVSVCVRECV